MLIYSQGKGEFRTAAGSLVLGDCYAGRGDAKNCPKYQDVPNYGPLPQGYYAVSPVHKIEHLGYAMTLTPIKNPDTGAPPVMFGRSEFAIHCINPAHPEDSSLGCICARTLDDLMKLGSMFINANTLQVIA